MKILHCLTVFLAILYIAVADDPSDSTDPSDPSDPAGPAGPTDSKTRATLPDPPKRDYPNVLKQVEGSFKLKEVSLDNALPSQVALWQLMPQNFQVVIWPPKFCHAVYICFIEKNSYNDHVHFNVHKDMCENEYMKLYPNNGQIKYKLNGGEEEKGYYMDHIVDFDTKDGNNFNTKVSSTRVSKWSQWNDEQANKVELKIDLENRDLLILSNSRFCHPVVTQPSRTPTYYPIFDVPHIKDSNLPEVFFDGLQMIKTTYIANVGNKKKSVDLLATLKNAKFENQNKEGRIEHQCNSYGARDMTGKLHFTEMGKDVSVNSIVVSKSADQLSNGTRAFRSFSIQLNDCHWFRLWVTDKDTKMSDYNEKLNVADTIDFFLNEGFFVPPDSDEARPLPGDSKYIGSIRFKIHATNPDSSKSLVEIAMTPFGKSYAYYEYFNMAKMHKSDFALHLIRAPSCDASFVQENLFDFNADRPATQMLVFGDCDFTYYTGTSF